MPQSHAEWAGLPARRVQDITAVISGVDFINKPNDVSAEKVGLRECLLLCISYFHGEFTYDKGMMLGSYLGAATAFCLLGFVLGKRGNLATYLN